MAFDEQGQADTYERKIQVCERAFHLLTEQVGFMPQDIIFDPNILAVATGMPEHDNYALDYIKATAWIRKHLKGAHVSGGVSNLSFSFRGNNYIREAMHAVFLYHAIAAGMDMGIVNPSTSVLYSDIPADELECIEDVVLNRRKDAADRLIALAERIKQKEEDEKSGLTTTQQNSSLSAPNNRESWRDASLEERLKYALTKGVDTYLEVEWHELCR